MPFSLHMCDNLPKCSTEPNGKEYNGSHAICACLHKYAQLYYLMLLRHVAFKVTVLLCVRINILLCDVFENVNDLLSF